MKEFKKCIYLILTNTVKSKKTLPCLFPSLRLVRNPSEKERFLMSQWPTSGNDRQSCLYTYALLSMLVVFIAVLQSVGSAYGTDNAADLGKKVYEEQCMICHGDKGDGKGLVGALNRVERGGRILNMHPRDFTVGVFRFRTTPTGCLPTDEDLLNIIEKGILKSSMPSFKDISKEEKNAVKDYIKTFSTRWKEEEPCKPIAMKKPKWIGKEDSTTKGKRIYKDMKCWECHGEDGKGKGTKADKLKDDWGRPIFPFNFTSGALKRGAKPEDVYITFTAGLDGTGMPSYEDSLNEEDRWHLVSYTLKLMRRVE